MKLAILADTHLSAAKYSKVDKKTHLPRFMMRQFDSLAWVADYLQQHGITTILHAGDMFDSTATTAYPLIRTRELLKDFDVYAIKGNHDDNSLLHEQEVSLIDLIGIKSISKPMARVMENTNYVFVPWGFEIDTSLIDHTKKNVLIAHGFLHPEFYHDENASDVLDEKKMSKFDLVIAGHNHSMECYTKDKTTYLSPGSLSNYANHYAEQPYLWILDSDALALEKVPIEVGVRKYKMQKEDPNSYLATIDEEALYQLEVPFSANIEKDVLQKAKKCALDIAISYMPLDTIDIEIKEKCNFWDYVKENSDYTDRFREICEVQNAAV